MKCEFKWLHTFHEQAVLWSSFTQMPAFFVQWCWPNKQPIISSILFRALGHNSQQRERFVTLLWSHVAGACLNQLHVLCAVWCSQGVWRSTDLWRWTGSFLALPCRSLQCQSVCKQNRATHRQDTDNQWHTKVIWYLGPINSWHSHGKIIFNNSPLMKSSSSFSKLYKSFD